MKMYGNLYSDISSL